MLYSNLKGRKWRGSHRAPKLQAAQEEVPLADNRWRGGGLLRRKPRGCHHNTFK